MSPAGIPVNAVAGGSDPSNPKERQERDIIQLFMLYRCSCYTIVRAIQLCVLYNCACYTIVRAIQLCVLYNCACYTIVHAI